MGTFDACGVIAGLAIGWPIDRFGLKPVVLLFLFAAPLLASFAAVLGSYGPLLAAMAATGALLLPLQIGLNGVAASLYPKPLRAKGVGWGLGSVRVGQILGASGGGLLIGQGVGTRLLFLIVAAFLAAGVAASLALERASRRAPPSS